MNSNEKVMKLNKSFEEKYYLNKSSLNDSYLTWVLFSIQLCLQKCINSKNSNETKIDFNAISL